MIFNRDSIFGFAFLFITILYLSTIPWEMMRWIDKKNRRVVDLICQILYIALCSYQAVENARNNEPIIGPIISILIWLFIAIMYIRKIKIMKNEKSEENNEDNE